MERDEDGRLVLTKKPGKYRSTAMVRSLRLQRLKETTMSRTAALDVRQAAKLGVTKVPKPKVYGRKKGTFSDITKMLSSGGMGYGQKPKTDDKKGSAVKSTTKTDTKVSQHDEDDDEEKEVAPKLNEDQRRAALILSVKDRRPANARHFGRQDLLDFQKGFDRKKYMEFKRRMNTKLEELTQKIREKYERRKKKLDEAGFFHPSANAMRVESAFQNELQKRLSLDEIEGKVLDEMLRESRGEVINKKSSALDSKFDNLLKLNEVSKKEESKDDTKKKRKGSKSSPKPSANTKQPSKGILKNNSNANTTTSNNKEQKSSDGGKNDNNDVEDGNINNNNAEEDIALPGKEEGPAGKLANEIARKVAGNTEAELRKRTSDRHVKDPFGDEENEEDEVLAEEANIWDNPDSDEEVDGKIGQDGTINEDDGNAQELTTENVAATQSQFASGWTDDIQLDDGEGSDVGSELTEDMEQNVEVKVKKKKKVKLDSFEKFKLERRRAVRARNIRRNQKLKEGKLNETIDDADFKDLSRHRSAVIQIALGSGKHTIKRKTVRKYETIGDKAVKAPLPKYVAKEIRQLGGTIKGGSFDVNKKEEEEEAEKLRLEQEQQEKEEAEKKKKAAAEKVDSDSEDEYDEEEEEEEEEIQGKVGLLTKEEEEERLRRKKERARARRKKRKEMRKEEDGEPLIRRVLEQIWYDLKMPNSLKIEFAIKYSSPDLAEELSEALPRWQRASMAIISRENLLATMRYLDEMRQQNEFVSIRSLFSKKQIDHLMQLDVWIPKEDMFEASALTWVKAMEENLRPVAKELILELRDLHDDVITFRGQKYIKYLKSHIENPSLIPGEPLLFAGNPYLRRTGTLLVGR